MPSTNPLESVGLYLSTETAETDIGFLCQRLLKEKSLRDGMLVTYTGGRFIRLLRPDGDPTLY